MNIVSLREAKAQGLPRYYTGLPCKRGHLSERYTNGRNCVVCEARKADGTPPAPKGSLPTNWPLWRADKLRRLVSDGCSYSKIGGLLGITKNAAIGRAHRMGLEHPNAPAKPPHTTIQRLDALNLFPSSGECVFPLGHPKEDGFHFCGGRVYGVRSYCSAHLAKTYLLPKEKSGGVFVFGRAAE